MVKSAIEDGGSFSGLGEEARRGKSVWETEPFEPSYLKLYRSGELYNRAREAVRSLKDCTVCPRDCHVDRSRDRRGICKTGRYAWVSNYFAHFGEEDCLRGRNGSGTIFFAMCNLRCVFCQNFEISHQRAGSETPPEKLADIMLLLQEKGCHNINLVTPEHVVPQVIEALPFAINRGLRLPIVYNTSAYDSLESLRLLDGIVDIYMPDFKYWEEFHCTRYLKAADYSVVARAAIKEMHRQVGDLTLDDFGLARRGLLVRHLMMPEGSEDTKKILHFLATEVSPHTYVNLMDQYRPMARVNTEKYSEINRRPTPAEYELALETTDQEGLSLLQQRQKFIFVKKNEISVQAPTETGEKRYI